MAKGEISSLPVWAQQYIAKLAADAGRAQQDLADYKARETATLEDSAVVADPYSECPRPLGTGTPVRFVAPDVHFDVSFNAEQGILDITATGKLARRDGIAVYPSTGNGIRVAGGRL